MIALVTCVHECEEQPGLFNKSGQSHSLIAAVWMAACRVRGPRSGLAEGEPIANSVNHGVPVASDDEPVLVIADDLLELALRLSLSPATCALEDPVPLAVYPTVTDATQRWRALSHESPPSPVRVLVAYLAM